MTTEKAFSSGREVDAFSLKTLGEDMRKRIFFFFFHLFLSEKKKKKKKKKK